MSLLAQKKGCLGVSSQLPQPQLMLSSRHSPHSLLVEIGERGANRNLRLDQPAMGPEHEFAALAMPALSARRSNFQAD